MALTASAGKRASRSHSAAKGASRSAAKLRAMSRIMICCSFSDMMRLPSVEGGAINPSCARGLWPRRSLARRRAVTSISMRMRGSTRPAMMAVEAGPDLAEILPEDRRDLRPVLGLGHDVIDPHHIGQARAGLFPAQRRYCGRSDAPAPPDPWRSTWRRSRSRWCRRRRPIRPRPRRGNSRPSFSKAEPEEIN